jgi:addiction module HigA family antidote
MLSKSTIITAEVLQMASNKRQIAPVHPGEILHEEFLKPLGMTINALALALRVPSNRIYAIVQGDRGVSGDSALRLARYFGTSAEFWINLQAHYDLEVARAEAEADIERAVQPREQSA